MTGVIKVAKKLNEFLAAALTKEDERQMLAADRHPPEDRDEMLQEIRSVRKQVIKKCERPPWLGLLSPESPVAGKRGN